MRPVPLLLFFVIRLCSAQSLWLIPVPQQVVIKGGFFPLHSQCVLRDSAGRGAPAWSAMEAVLGRLGLDLPEIGRHPRSDKKSDGGIFLKVRETEAPGHYRLLIEPRYLEVAGSPSGVFHGLMTLAQLILGAPKAQDTVYLPCLQMEDQPRFGWRGMHLDVVRHFFPVEFLKKYIDLLALYKFNVFHWHLTDDQGWRIEIKKYPQLTQKGSVRHGSMVGHYNEGRVDDLPYGGFYTQDEVREVVRYAAERHITVVPEIEMPGHAQAALAVFPRLSCTGGPFEVGRVWGIYEDVFCTKEEVFDFLKDVLTEVASLFPSPYIHIGGDECPKTRWKVCGVCQGNIRRLGLRDEHALQSYFIRRIEAILQGLNKKLMGWDEIMEGGLAQTATVMSWRGTEGGLQAAMQGNDVVMSPGRPCYFDHRQKVPEDSLTIGGYNPLSAVYAYEPIPPQLPSEKHVHILGAQGNVWTEYMTHPAKVEYMVLPRLPALSEVLWSPAIKRDWQDFLRRIQVHKTFWQAGNYQYCETVE
ncbi:MAG: beta-N-acetylhexosaminidase [Flavobacteriales bacterium]|nr:beta-N-acetylhexosaminidase [Flavobacteriales bacterium]